MPDPDRDVAVITGGGGGIGRATAGCFAARGWSVVLTDVDEEAVERAAAALREQGGDCRGWVSDVSVAADWRRLADRLVAELGTVRALVNNAGTGKRAHIFDFTDGDVERILGVDLVGVINGCRYLGPIIADRSSGGAIVNISSTVALRAPFDSAVYTAAKAGVIGATKAIAVDLAERGVRVNAVAPGFIDSNPERGLRGRPGFAQGVFVTPMRRWGSADDVATVVVFLASDDAAFVTGQTISVDGGLDASTMQAPGWPPEDVLAAALAARLGDGWSVHRGP